MTESPILIKALPSADGVLLDWDGCVAFGDKPHPAAVRFLQACGRRCAIVSNNSTLLPQEFSSILLRAGVSVPTSRIALAGVEAIRRAKESGARRVLMLGESHMKAYARNTGLNVVQDDADLVLLLRDTRFSYARLERAANCVKGGARVIVANPDLTHPGCNGRVVPETGALLAALRASAGDFEAEVVGKPGPRLFEAACKALGVRREHSVMIGDNPDTDIAGAAAFGLGSVLIGARSGIGFDELMHPNGEAHVQWAANRASLV